MAVFALGGLSATRAQVSAWLKKEEAEGYAKLHDEALAQFLNGFIIKRRGKRDGPQPAPEKRLSNNQIFMKLKIALALQADEVLDILSLVDFKLSKHELSAFFRKPTHRHYRECQDQVLRNFLHGLQIKYRDASAAQPVNDNTNDTSNDATDMPATASPDSVWKPLKK